MEEIKEIQKLYKMNEKGDLDLYHGDWKYYDWTVKDVVRHLNEVVEKVNEIVDVTNQVIQIVNKIKGE